MSRRGKHRERSSRLRNVTVAALIAAGVTLTVTEVARADPGVSWDSIAACESSGNWSIHTGNFEGGLQFLPSTWKAYGGGQYAAHAYQATREQQISIAQKVLAGQGIGAWPLCGKRAGDSTPHVVARQPAAAPNVTPTQTPALTKPAPWTGPTTSYTVNPGDCLTTIAATHQIQDWRAVWAANPDLNDPNMIRQGRELRLPTQ